MNLASVYARSLYDLAASEKTEKAIYSEILNLQSCFEKAPEYLKLISSPALEKKEIKKLILEVVGDVPSLLINTLSVLIDRNDSALFFDLLAEYIKIYHDKNNIAVVKVFSAIPLSEPQTEKLKDKLQKHIGKQIILQAVVDSSCMGGLIIQLDDKQYDDSVRGKLSEIGELLTSHDDINREIL